MAKCMDCDIQYASPEWVEMVIPHNIWNTIAPDDGLLCPSCMKVRLINHGFDDVPTFLIGHNIQTGHRHSLELVLQYFMSISPAWNIAQQIESCIINGGDDDSVLRILDRYWR